MYSLRRAYRTLKLNSLKASALQVQMTVDPEESERSHRPRWVGRSKERRWYGQ
jgi:hypothetical protein